ncbi:hypothetical protein BGX21_004296 [Mortierella sp. AD011]|nr:hypothetical protein BGX20_006291 [Mortierella sp. AD010]KAF9373869.1 hypothetical protein BGX21_004296 [Mortierella sp. AD011]
MLAIPISSVPKSSITTQTSTSTTASPPPRVAPPVSVTTSTLLASPATPTTTTNFASSSSSSSIGTTASGTSNTLSNSPSSNAGGGAVPLITFTAYAPTIYPTATPPYLVPGSDLPAGVDSEPHHGSSKSVLAVLSSLGVIVCVTLVVMPLVIRHRRKKAAARASRTVLPRSMDPGVGGVGGGARVVMKESKSIFRISRKPKGGYFYKMEDEDDDQVEICTGEGSDRNTKLTTSSNETHPVTVTAQGSSIKEEILERAVHPPLATPQQVHLEPSPMLHVPGALSPFENSLTREYTMSSTGSNLENSSVIRRYWEASMAARAECSTHQSQTHIGHEEGSIFGDDSSRDSESRMADILSLRSSGNGSITETLGTMERYNNRRSTLGGVSSFGNETSLTTTISSVPDSLLISEEEFLERLQMHQLEQEYYNRYYPDHHDQYPTRSSISRSNSIPSLTSTNDPFKTFDSNEILVDVDPFSDSRAVSRASQRSDQSL